MLTREEIATAADDAQALIEEARRRHRARRRRIAVALCAAVLAGGIGYVASGSGGASNAPAHKARSGAAPSAPPQLQWKELAANGLPPGSTVTSVTTYHGHLVAAGQYFSGAGYGDNTVAPGYPVAASPVVWTSTDGTSWTLAWQPGGIVLGSGAFPQLVATPDGLFAFDSGTGGTALWRSSDGTTFVRQTLPEGMAGRLLSRAVFGHGRLVVTEQSNGAGGPAYAGAGGVIWSSSNGISWQRDGAPKNAGLGKVAVTGTGFLLAGESASTHPTVWTSRDGVTWRARTLGRRGLVSVAAHGAEMVASVSWKLTPLVLWSSNGEEKWTRSPTTLTTNAYTAGPFTVPGGFAIVGHPPTGPHLSIWYSATGAQWSKAVMSGTPANGATIARFFPDDGGLIGVTRSTGSGEGVSFWQATIANRGG